MRSIFALIGARWRTALSYRVRMSLSVFSLLASVIPLYFVAGALQDTMANSIRAESSQYFGFVLVGTLTFALVNAAVRTLPSEVGSGISNGTLEALLTTRSRVPTLLAGLSGFAITWSALRVGVALIVGWLLGATIAWSQIVPATLIILLVVATFLPFGLMATAMVLAFRTVGPFPQAVLFLSAALGGVYYPTTVIPGWLETVSGWIPLTYGLRALRKVLLNGAGLGEVMGDVLVLSGFGAVLTVVGALALRTALEYARRVGTLTQY